VGSPCGNGTAYLLPEDMFTSTNFSMGVVGNVVPEPLPWAMLALGAVVLIGVRQFRRKKKA
jgi:uncharacterized membrane protein